MEIKRAIGKRREAGLNLRAGVEKPPIRNSNRLEDATAPKAHLHLVRSAAETVTLVMGLRPGIYS